MSEIAIYRQFAGEGPAALACVCAPPTLLRTIYEQLIHNLWVGLSNVFG
jgi:hypothetical protein